jgi:hypothetical protein
MTNADAEKQDRLKFQDCTEIIANSNSTFFANHSLCANCSDYYEVPPCMTDLNSDRSCFPSLMSPDRN